MELYQKSFQIRWSDVDANAHVRHSAYLDYCATLRMTWLDANGYSIENLTKQHLGPVLFKETISYFKELKPDGFVTVQLRMGGMSESGHKWSIEHSILNAKGEVAASLAAAGAWFDTKARKVVAPPAELLSLMKETARAEGFKEL